MMEAWTGKLFHFVQIVNNPLLDATFFAPIIELCIVTKPQGIHGVR